MKNLQKTSIAIMVLVIIAGCDKDSDNHYLGTLKFGSYYNNCIGYCYQTTTFSDSIIIFEKIGENPATRPDIRDTITISADYWRRLINSFNFDSFKSMPPVSGCPDCADGGRGWIEITTEDQTHKKVFQLDNPPLTIRGLLRTISEVQ